MTAYQSEAFPENHVDDRGVLPHDSMLGAKDVDEAMRIFSIGGDLDDIDDIESADNKESIPTWQPNGYSKGTDTENELSNPSKMRQALLMTENGRMLRTEKLRQNRSSEAASTFEGKSFEKQTEMIAIDEMKFALLELQSGKYRRHASDGVDQLMLDLFLCFNFIKLCVEEEENKFVIDPPWLTNESHDVARELLITLLARFRIPIIRMTRKIATACRLKMVESFEANQLKSTAGEINSKEIGEGKEEQEQELEGRFSSWVASRRLFSFLFHVHKRGPEMKHNDQEEVEDISMLNASRSFATSAVSLAIITACQSKESLTRLYGFKSLSFFVSQSTWHGNEATVIHHKDVFEKLVEHTIVTGGDAWFSAVDAYVALAKSLIEERCTSSSCLHSDDFISMSNKCLETIVTFASLHEKDVSKLMYCLKSITILVGSMGLSILLSFSLLMPFLMRLLRHQDNILVLQTMNALNVVAHSIVERLDAHAIPIWYV